MNNRTGAIIAFSLLMIGFMFFNRETSADKQVINADPSLSGRLFSEGVGAPLDADFTGIPGDDRIFVTEKGGSIRILGVPYATPFFDISEKVARSNEKGMLGMVFDPDFATNKYFYVFYTGPFDETVDPPTFTTRIERYTVSDDPNFADLDSGVTILELKQFSQFHNGGNMIFGPDGYLYVGIGDDNDRRLAQDLNSLNGKLLRLDLDPNRGLPPDCDLVSGNYSIPADNPFVNADACGEVWAYGLRNPWRFSFDTVTNDLFLGDVGDESFEEINWAPASSNGGENYGWPYFEGTDCAGGVFEADCTATTNHEQPIYAYPHSNGGGSVTGGYVYRGTNFPNLYGHYVFADFTNSVLTTAIFENNSWQFTDHGPMLTSGAPLISSFGQDPGGEIYAVRITDGNPAPGQSTGSVWRVIDEYGFDIEISAPSSVGEGEAIEYRLTVTNIGSQPAANVLVENEIPAGVTHQSGGLVSGTNVIWNIPTLAVEESVDVTWTALPFKANVTNTTYQVSADGGLLVKGSREVNTSTAVPAFGIRGRLFQDYNTNGLDDDFELGVEDITVKLWDDNNCDGQIQTGGLVGLVETESDGSYFFNLEDAQISNCYMIKLELGSLPASVSLTSQNVGSDDSIDSDFFSNGWVERFSVPVEPVSAGFVGFTTVPPPTATPDVPEPMTEVYGRVFNDQNANGIDDGEPGISGVEVTLYRDAECDGEVSGPDIYRRTDTLSTGVYLFSVDDPTGCFLFKANPNDLPAGWIMTERNVGSNDSVDSDVYSFGWTEIFRLPIPAISAGAYNPSLVTPVPATPEPPIFATSTPKPPIFATNTPKPFATPEPGTYPPTSTPLPFEPPTIGPDYESIFLPAISR